MGLSGGKQSNGKLRWRSADNVKMDLRDRLCVLVWGVGGWHRLMHRAHFDTDSTRRSRTTARCLSVLVWI
jgi:hypothetical protein